MPINLKQLFIKCGVFLFGFAAAINLNCHAAYSPAGYSIKTIETPKDVRFHITGLDIDKDGSIVCATRIGDVWRFKNNAWQLIADGLHEPTGLLIEEDGTLLVAQKPELTRLVDSDKNGIFDEYIRIADGWEFHDNYHEFNFGPVKDLQGNIYGALNLGHQTPDAFKYGGMDSAGGYRGWAYRVTPTGKFEPWAYGLRSPAGMGVSPKGEIFFSDNQGDWVGTSKIHLLRQNEFYGHPASLIDLPEFNRAKVAAMTADDFNKMRELPNVWIPHQEVANSPGNLVWNSTGGKFGPFENQIFVGDQTQSNIFRVLLDKVGDEYQGAVITFMDGFQSGNIRLAFDKKGSLWVGQTARGWAARGGKPFGLEKVEWDGTQPFELETIKLNSNGFKLVFTQDIAKKTIDTSSFTVSHWHYHYNQKYGSPKVDVTPVQVTHAKSTTDPKALEISLPLVRNKVYGIRFNGITSKTGKKPSSNTVYYTLNKLYQ